MDRKRCQGLSHRLTISVLALIGASLGCDRKEALAPVGTLAPAPPAPSSAKSRPPAPKGGLRLTGVVLLDDQAHVPAGPPPPKATESFCAARPIADESLLLGAHGEIKNVMVHVTSGGGGPYAPPEKPVIFDQRDCMYRPRVLGAVFGQDVQVRNSDATLHNVHALIEARTVLNLVQVDAQSPAVSLLGAPAGTMYKLRCDVHPWMTAYLFISDHPFFAVTDEAGRFTLENLPPGEYTLAAWHERLGQKTLSLTLPALAKDVPEKPLAPLEIHF